MDCGICEPSIEVYLVFVSVPVMKQTSRYEKEIVLVTAWAVVPAAVRANFGLPA